MEENQLDINYSERDFRIGTYGREESFLRKIQIMLPNLNYKFKFTENIKLKKLLKNAFIKEENEYREETYPAFPALFKPDPDMADVSKNDLITTVSNIVNDINAESRSGDPQQITTYGNLRNWIPDQLGGSSLLDFHNLLTPL